MEPSALDPAMMNEPWREVLREDQTLTRPHFMVIGAPRCGTTSMYDALAQHPMIHMSPNKEPQFFAYLGLPDWRGPHDAQGIRDPETYHALFDGAQDEQRTGEASTLYLWGPHAARSVARLLPEDTKAIAMLRSPAHATWSRYTKARNRGIEDEPDIFAAIDAEPRRRDSGWSPFWYYRALRDYGPQLDRWYDALGTERVHVVLFDDYKADPQRVVREVYQFLGVDPHFTPELGIRHNASGRPRNNLAGRVLRSRSPVKSMAKLLPEKTRERLWLRLRSRSIAPQRCPPDIERRLKELFEPETRRTEETLGISLDTWHHHG